MNASICEQLLRFQSKIRLVNKDSKGYGYSYASFDNIVSSIAPHLEEVGLGYIHTFEGQDIVCTLFNGQGEVITSKLTLPQESMKGMNLNQSMGASITYARRYTLTAILGLVADDDTDSNISTAPETSDVSKGQKQAPKDGKPKWFNLRTKDGEFIPKNKELVIQALQKGANASDVISHLEKSGYQVYSTARKDIESLEIQVRKPLIEEEDNIEEIPF